jgi:RimJ/RimL family protein N-acetyltransferase
MRIPSHRGRIRPVEAPVLGGHLVRLEPLTLGHVDGLVAAAGENRDSYSFTTVPESRPDVIEYVDEILAATAAGETIAFVQVRVADDAAVGVTRFLSFRRGSGADLPYAVEIGGTWLAASAQRTGINVEAKLLLLTHAFDVWNVGRVDFKTDARNARSRAALAGMGASFEAVLRSWQPSHATGEDGLLRDSAMYAIVASDWPSVRGDLRARLRDR